MGCVLFLGFVLTCFEETGESSILLLERLYVFAAGFQQTTPAPVQQEFSQLRGNKAATTLPPKFSVQTWVVQMLSDMHGAFAVN